MAEVRLHHSAHKGRRLGQRGIWRKRPRSPLELTGILPRTRAPDRVGPTQSWAEAGPACPQTPGARDGKESVQPAAKVGFPRVCKSGSPAS